MLCCKAGVKAAVVRTVVLAVSIGAARCGGGTPTQPGPMPKAVASVTVNGWLSPLAVGQAVQLSATAIWNDGTSRSVTTEAAWQTTDSTVAVVSSAGLVLAQGGGTATVRATYQGVGGALSVAVEGTTLPSGPLPGLTCGTERWAVKTLSDASANAVDVLNVQQTSIRDLNTKATHCDGGPNIRGHAEEFSVYEVVGRVTFVRLEDDRDYHLAIAEPEDPSYTMVTEVADIACQGAMSSPRRAMLESARNQLIQLLGGRSPSSLVGSTVRVRGVGFFDFNHGQTGRARNCMELHPILEITTAR